MPGFIRRYLAYDDGGPLLAVRKVVVPIAMILGFSTIILGGIYILTGQAA